MEQDIRRLNKQRHSVIEWIGKKSSFESRCTTESFAQGLPLRCVDDEQQRSYGVAEQERYVAHVALRAEKMTKAAFGYQIDKGTGCKPVKNGKYHCRFCGKSFQWCSHWLAHERIHTGERPFKCEICKKAFTRSDGLKCHKLTHGHEKKAASSQVSQNSSTHIVLNKSIAYKPMRQEINDDAQKGTKELKCGSCNRLFNRPSALEIHSRVHTGVKPYPCNICSKSFSIYGNLKRHLLIHTGERPYTCAKCSISFNNSSHLKRHIKNKH